MLVTGVETLYNHFELRANCATNPNIVGPTMLRVIASVWCSSRRSCVTRVRRPNNVGRALQTDPTLLRYASAITEQKKCWEWLAQKFDRFQTLHNNSQQHPTTCNSVCKRTQHVTSNNVATVCAGLFSDLTCMQSYCLRDAQRFT